MTSSLARDLLLDFFAMFSAFECALKRNGFLRKTEEGAIAEPNWDKFASSIRDTFPGQSTARSDALHVEYLKKKPPKKQVVAADGMLTWVDAHQKHLSDAESIIWSVRTIRNNLFHGGKYPGLPIDEPARDERLMTASIVCLAMAAKCNPTISRTISELLADHEWSVPHLDI